ncbi:hypothetical protein TpMuguga_03g02630 [Theileria parva strain Muguga]|uniref:uncharacterized protein n=1 Tax=Theileria parva strain Muguga TaxID=333668 RepID=UPI001C61F743|nr:uncharacterized protein TpMuguga_03g02630 [Theileria parva strain Muguga]KAF5153168.1 hypothetical protein TpMuguga_03g02630 [Theileria parva strain Muguga]
MYIEVTGLRGILSFLFLRPRKLSLRQDRRCSKKEYRIKRHKYGYNYKWLGS